MGKLKDYNILLVEDNEVFANNFSQTLDIYFHTVFYAKDIERGFYYYDTHNIDVIICDIKIADTNGLDFIRQIREYDKNIPIVILSAYKNEEFLFGAIGLNILTYELKPLSFEKMQKLLYTISKSLQSSFQKIAENIYYHHNTQELHVNQKIIALTKKESLFIELLLENKHTIITDEDIQTSVWQEILMSKPALKNFLLRLRKKIELDLIVTVHGVGYKLQGVI